MNDSAISGKSTIVFYFECEYFPATCNNNDDDDDDDDDDDNDDDKACNCDNNNMYRFNSTERRKGSLCFI